MCLYLQRDLFEPVKRGVAPGGIVIAVVHITEPGGSPTGHRLRVPESLPPDISRDGRFSIAMKARQAIRGIAGHPRRSSLNAIHSNSDRQYLISAVSWVHLCLHRILAIVGFLF